MLKLVNVTRRMAVIEMTGGASITLTRSRKDGTTVGFRGGSSVWRTLDVQELIDGLMWITMTDDDLIERGFNADQIKVRRPKRSRKNVEKNLPF